MMKTIAAVIHFCPQGVALCLYTEAIDLASLGRLSVRRASQVEFDNVAQGWRVRDLDGKELYASRSRAGCLAWEQSYFNGDDAA